MRIKTNELFYARKSQVYEPRTKHFIIFEGIKSEQLYFDALLKKYDVITNVFFFLRDKDKEGWTNPQKIMELLLSIINGDEKISFTYNTIFENFYDYISQFVTTITKEDIKKVYVSKVNKSGEQLDNFIDIVKLNSIINDLIENYFKQYKISDIFHDDNLLKKLIEEQSTFDKKIDKIYLVVDRDKKSFMIDQYNDTLKKASENDVHFYVFNPCFEFWLLLHHKDCLEYSKETLFENEYVTASNTFVYIELKKYDPLYTKSRFNAGMYIDNITTAIVNAKNFETNIVLLKDHVGTNIVSLLDELLKRR